MTLWPSPLDHPSSSSRLPRRPRAAALGFITALAAALGGLGCGAREQPSPSATASEPAGRSVLEHANSEADAPAGDSEREAAGDRVEPSASAVAAVPARCERLPFANELPVAEASGASYLPADGAAPPVILVVGDSGTGGQYIEIALDSGEVLASGKLPLGSGASDDLEGLSWSGGLVYGITSSGWMRHWRRHPARTGRARYELVAGPYPIAQPGFGEAGLVCDRGKDINCARNYEGLCLRQAQGAAVCVGFAVSKTDGELYCLRRGDDGQLQARPSESTAVAAGETLTGCHVTPDPASAGGELVIVGSNLFGANRVYALSGWHDPAQPAQVSDIGSYGAGFDEAIALAPGGVMYRFSDAKSARSLAAAYRCE
ncbi:hypothetical protein [Haliangium ochraceum]|uniref:Uncharacterized protein n=1 Tax=Haliangium ochraceum (strain DSM 14365 / JCM 11303 / SMP-2) TaxID=502025 RepID=D0LGT5_HALO1|nr:hypothetical protein [Haliangium ochraceum]ACY14657.1 hypothetical protein Hoch_2112 [Haliangium ochraceum DSM 14365]